MYEDAKVVAGSIFRLAASLIQGLHRVTAKENPNPARDDGAPRKTENMPEAGKLRRKRQLELSLEKKWSPYEKIKFYFEDDVYVFSKRKFLIKQYFPLS